MTIPGLPRLCNRRSSFGISLLLFVVVGWAFLPSIRNGFVGFDDDVYVYQNVHVQSGMTWQSIQWALTTLKGGFWHPLTWLSILVDCQLYGLQAWGHHLTSLLLHAANTVLLFLALQRMTRASWRSAFVALLFGLHPLHVESVAWASERKDVLSTLFWLLAMLAYARYAEVQGPEPKVRSPRARAAYVLALVFFLCGLTSKPMVVTLPLVLLLLDWWPLRRFSLSTIRQQHSTMGRLLWEKVPFLAVSFVFGAVTIYAERKVDALGPATMYPLADRLQNALQSYSWYLGKTFWPTGLAVFYPYPGAFSAWRSAAVGLAGLVISALLFRASRRWPYLAAGWTWYLLTLLPAIGLIQVGAYCRADRFTYVPLVGVFLVLTWAAWDWARRWRYGGYGLLVAAGVGAVLCTALTRRQIGFWKDDETLFGHALAVTKSNDVATYNLGVSYYNQGLTLAAQGAFDEAIRCYEKAIQFRPGKQEAHSSLAYALLKKGRLPEAAREYEQALRLKPDDAEAHNNLGHILAGQGRAKEATRHLSEALRLRADYPEAHDNLGAVLAGQGRYAEAAAQFREVLRLKPEYPGARQKLEQALAAQQKLEQATAPYRQAVQANPADPRAHAELGRALLERGQLDQAIEQCAEAARLDPKSVEFQYQYGAALARKGEAEKAVRQFELALAVEPDFAPAHYSLGILYQQQGQMSLALKYWREAARLAPQWPDPLNNVAWVLATDPDPDVRNGSEAVKLASRAVELSRTNNVGMLDTLAAAYAEAGRFAQARATAQQAQATATSQGQADLAEQIGQRLALYDAGQPYRQAPDVNK